MRKLIGLLIGVLTAVPVFALDNDNSGYVDLGDLGILAENWLVVDEPLNVSDLNGDEDINILDFEMLASQWLDPVAGVNISDHIDLIEMSSYINYKDPDVETDTEYHFDISVTTSDDVSKLYFESPAGSVYAMPLDDEVVSVVGDVTITTTCTYNIFTGQYDWFYDVSAATAVGLAGYGDGTITLTAIFDDGRRGSTEAWFGVPQSEDFLAQPTQLPEFTSFANNGSVGSPVTFEWEEYAGDSASVVALELVSDVHTNVYRNGAIELNPTGLEQAIALGDGDWVAKLAFINLYPIMSNPNSDGIEVRSTKYVEVDYSITVVSE